MSHIPRGRLPAGALLALTACAGSPVEPEEATPASPPAANSSEPPRAILAAPLSPVPGSVPTSIELLRNAEYARHYPYANLYRVVLRSHLLRVDGRVPQTSCVESDVWLVGPNAVPWPSTEPLSLPQDYGVTLPDGTYTQEVSGWAQVYRASNGLLHGGFAPGMPRPFVVEGGQLSSMSIEAYLDYAFDPAPRDATGAVIGTTAADLPPPPPPSPCSQDAPVDDAPPEGAVSVVDFGAAAGRGSLQPFRWSAVERTLSYQSELSGGFSLELRLALETDLASADGTALALDASKRRFVVLGPQRPTSRDQVWAAVSGTAQLRLLADGRLQLDLAELEFINEVDPTRYSATGSIVGAWVELP